jgi:hypothetical protein
MDGLEIYVRLELGLHDLLSSVQRHFFQLQKNKRVEIIKTQNQRLKRPIP